MTGWTPAVKEVLRTQLLLPLSNTHPALMRPWREKITHSYYSYQESHSLQQTGWDIHHVTEMMELGWGFGSVTDSSVCEVGHYPIISKETTTHGWKWISFKLLGQEEKEAEKIGSGQGGSIERCSLSSLA